MEGKGSWNQEKWVLLNQVYRDWVLVDLTQLLLICDISGTPRIRKWWQIFGTRSQKSQTSTRCCVKLSLLQIPFHFFSYLLSLSLNHFHPLISTFTFSDPIFSFLHKLSLSSIPFHALAQTFTFSSNCFFSSRTVKSTQRSLWGEWRPLARAKSIIILQNFAPTWIHFFFALAKPQIS